jgi:tetratricopeptide (TPR) repeat protein
MNESRANRKHLPFLVNFLALWYASQQERENKRQQLTNSLNQLDQHGRDNTFKALDYLAEASLEPNEKQQVDLELAVQQIKLGNAKEAKNRLTKIQLPQKIEPNGMMQWMQDNVMQWSEAKPEIDAIARIESIINYWQLQRSGELEQVSRLFHELSLDFSSHGLHQLHIALLKERLSEVKQLKLPEKEARLWLEIASSEKIDGKLSNAQESLNKALEIAINIKDRKIEGATLNNISQIFMARGDYDAVLKYLEQSLAIQQEIGDKSGLCVTLFNMGQIHKQNKAMEDAMSVWLNVYQLAKPMNLAQVLDALAELAPQIGLAEGLDGWEALLQQSDNQN